MKDFAVIEIDFDAGTVTATLPQPESVKMDHAVETTRAQLVANILILQLAPLMKMSKPELMWHYRIAIANRS